MLIQRGAILDQRRRMSGTFSATRIGSIRQVQEQIEQQMRGFGRPQAETSA